MATYTRILYQIIFGSKYCIEFINEDNGPELFSYIGGIINNRSSKPYIIGGYKNHIHIITSLHPAISLAQLVKDIKLGSRDFMNGKRNIFMNFNGWQRGYGGFTYQYSALSGLINYVQNQENHHKKISFKEELIALIKEHGIDYNEKYLLD